MIIGISSSFLEPNPMKNIFNHRPLLYLEESMVLYTKKLSAVPFIIPSIDASRNSVSSYTQIIDGLIISGGADISPETYNESPLEKEWSGSFKRDCFEIEICKDAVSKQIPVLGICRGAQIINVAFGGSLYQDNQLMIPGSLAHRCAHLYEKNSHKIHLKKGGYLESVFGINDSKVNSVHHQSVKKIGKGLVVEAFCPDDSVVEAIKLESNSSYCLGIQWHPEFQTKEDIHLLNSEAVLHDFYNAIKKRK